MQQALIILEENSIPNAIKKFEKLKMENLGAQVLLMRVNQLYQSLRVLVCRWIVSIESISNEFKYQAYNILGCTLEEEDNKIQNFKNALKLGVENKFDLSHPLINLQKVYINQKEYAKVRAHSKYLNYFSGRHKVVALHLQAKAFYGLNLTDECQKYSQDAFEQSKQLFGIEDPMTIRMSEYINLLFLNENEQQQMSIDLGRSFTQFDFKEFTNNNEKQQAKKQSNDQIQQIDSRTNQSFYKKPFMQMKSDEAFTNKKYSYQLEAQKENNISQLDKMIYLQNTFIQRFLIESVQKDINLKLDQKLFQYQIISQSKQKQDEINDFFSKLKNTLDKVVILNFNCSSEKEAIRIKNNLLLKKFSKNITKELNLENLNIMLSSDIDLNDFQLYIHLQQQAQLLKQDTNQIIAICQLVQPINIIQLQKQFQEMAQKFSHFRVIKEQFEIEVASNPDQNVIDQKLQQIQKKEEQFDITVSLPQYRAGNKKFVVYSTIEYWFDQKNQQMGEVGQLMAKVKDQILEIYFPSLNIILNDPKQIKLWQKYLNQFHPNNAKESCSVNTQLIIELKGESSLIDEKYKQIQIDLKQFCYKRFNFEVDVMIAQILAEKENFENLYQSSFKAISQQFGNCLIQIAGVDENIIQVDVFIDDQKKLNSVQQHLYKGFFKELSIYIEKNFDIEDLFNCLGIQSQQFRDQYYVEVSKINKEYYFISQNASLNEIQKQIVKSKQYLKENRKTLTLECQNILILNELKINHAIQSNYGIEDVFINFSQNQKIILQAMDQELLTQKLNQINSDIKKLESELINTFGLFQEKQIKFLKKNFKQYYPSLENERKANLKFQTTKYTLISQVICQDKKLQLVQADITQLECDAIINFHSSSNSNLGLSKLTEKILDFGGDLYQQCFYTSLTNSIPTQNQFDIIIYEVSQLRNIRFIINLIITPQCTLDMNNPQSINQIITNLFNKIQDCYQITRLAIPIFKICYDNPQSQIQTYFNVIIDKLLNSEHPVKLIYIAEKNQKRITTAESILLQISKVSVFTQSKCQWQWKDTINYVDYSEDLNQQLNDAYDQFLQSNQEVTKDLKFSIESKPSTHSVDLANLKIQEKSNNTQQDIIFKRKNKKVIYYINNEELGAELTQYFINMYNKKCYTFDIFWKDLAVVINNSNTYQLNKKTKYQRKIKRIPQIESKSEPKQKITYEFSINSIQELQNQIVIQSFDSKLNQQILQEIKQKLKESIISLKIDIPQFNDTQQKKFYEYLETVAQRINGKVISGKSMNIEIFKNKDKKIFKQLDLIKSYSKIEFPKEWIPQQENFIKVQLDQNSREYRDIKNLFSKTDNGTIIAIFRIQNIILWENYILESNKLFDVCSKQKRLLLPEDKKRYLWHGVAGQHPSIIYKSQTEAFDVSFSRVGLWGQGIYFAENALYSRNYSYVIQTQDDPQYAGNRVFLCCLVTTGKVEERQSSSDIKRPSDGYDCVSGFTNGSNVFIIYQMHVRRAYPAYEVIYQ